MTALAFDTLKLARNLQSAGFTVDQAQGAASALAEAVSAADPATKDDLATLEKGLRSELTAATDRLTTAIALSEQRMTIRLGGMLVVVAGTVLTVIHFMLAH